MKVEFKGLDKLQKKLNEIGELRKIQEVVKVNTTEMHRKASRKVPVDTGHLKRSITTEFTDGGLTGRVSTDVEYAVYVEYGTRFMTSRAFFRPSLYEQRIQFQKDMSRLLKK